MTKGRETGTSSAPSLSIDAERLHDRIRQLGQVGRGEDGNLTRLAASNADKAGRDALAGWIVQAGLELAVDRIGNMFGIWHPVGTRNKAPVMIGSHIDTVIDAGVYDGCYGVLAGLEVLSALRCSRP
jgi:N-carbamoyl-L-amino-acid hydrolase